MKIALGSDHGGFSLAVSRGNAERGILVCTTGIGMDIAANRFRGVRAARCREIDEVKRARRHNAINVLAMGSCYTNKKGAIELIDAFLNTEAEGGRHERRRRKIDNVVL